MIWFFFGVLAGISAGATLVNWLDFLHSAGYAGVTSEELLQEEE